MKIGADSASFSDMRIAQEVERVEWTETAGELGGASPGIKIDQGTPAHTQQTAATLRRSASLVKAA